MDHDIIILGGGPAGLSAALVLGRARKRVLLCDDGPPRNAPAAHMQGFVTRDGVSPAEFRRLARAEQAAYPTVQHREQRARGVEARGPGSFAVTLADGAVVTARRVLLCVGVIDELPALPGLAGLWGKSVHLCPYCHGWELQDRRTGYLCTSPKYLEWAVLLRGWSREVTLFTGGLAVEPELRARLERAGVAIEARSPRRLIGDDALTAVELDDGTRLAMEGLYMHPPQRQTDLVRDLGLALDELGYVKIDEHRQTSVPGIYAAGDLTTPMQGALLAAAAGMFAAATINHGLTVELALAGALD
jgi:thioredoxin reductase